MAWVALMANRITDGTEIDDESFENELKKYNNDVTVSYDENEDYLVYFTDTTHTYKVDSNGNIILQENIIIPGEPEGEIPENPYEYTRAGAYSLEIPVSGYYEIECWGAQGGASYSNSCHGGYGGYSTGIAYLQKGKKLWIYVGGQGSGDGTHKFQEGGFNGGGDANTDNDGNTRQSSGGGATHIAIGNTDRGELKNYKSENTIYWDEILIVAGGGGGAGANSAVLSSWINGGSGGGANGGYTVTNLGIGISEAYGGSQVNGGIAVWRGSEVSALNGSFGKGGTASNYGGGGGRTIWWSWSSRWWWRFWLHWK